jgi:uracil-DNA glycosylase family 4
VSASEASTTGPTLSAPERREALKSVFQEAQACVRCAELAATRRKVVFGSGNADADLMFVGEAPGASEDEQGIPFVGQAGKLLERLLGEIGLARSDVFIANVLKCLRYNVPVQLGDGSWERIGGLVRSRYSGEVMSVDRDGRLVRRRVTGWHATALNGRSVYRLTYRSAKHAGRGRTGIELTGDHPVLTERGFVAAEGLQPGDRIATGQGMSALVRDVVCATLLGDGSLSQAPAQLSFGHPARQADYAAFKAELLAELDPQFARVRVAAVSGGERGDSVVHVRTRAHTALDVLRREFYERGKRVPRWLADGLNERMLAIWFMDGADTTVRSGGQRGAGIATPGFDDRDRQVLLNALLRLGVPAKASRGRLYLDALTTRTLSELIAPYVPPAMRHKLHPEVEARVPFQPRRMRAGPPEVVFDEVEVDDVTQTWRRDTTFFCIDVEQTHNFVTAGGVVHNCRPPGNRDPLPAEIHNCQEYLYRQVELVQPRVICTLGNFATKLLRGDPAGITRVHGQPETITVGRRTVRLYPIYHPAAALYTPRMLETLRDDFARLPALLEQPAPEQTPVLEAPETTAVEEERSARPPDGLPERDVAGASAPDDTSGPAPAGESPAQAPATEQLSATEQLGLF